MSFKMDSLPIGKKQAVPPLKSAPGNAPADMGNMDNCFASFMGSGALPFDLQKNIFGDSSANQSQLSSSSHNTSSQMDQTSSPGDSNEQGKPIEVISMRSKSEDENFGIGSFLKSLSAGSAARSTSVAIPGLGDPLPVPPPVMPPTPHGVPTTTSYTYQLPPLQPPPLPPMMDSVLYPRAAHNESSEAHDREDSWKTTLPPKFPTWRDAADNEWERDSVSSENQEANDWVPALPVSKLASAHNNMETPESPPHFEKECFREPVEYDETSVGTARSGHGVADVDHRMLVDCRLTTPCRNSMERTAPHASKDIDHRLLNSRFKKDVDHRNLISLTGSPANDVLAPPPSPPQVWGHDQDYRSIPMPPSNDEREHRRGRASDGVVDNVESVDMEMSDEDDDYGHHRSSGSQDKKWHDRERYDHHMDGSVIPTVGPQSSNLPLPPPPPPPPIPQPEFRTDMRVPPPPMDFPPIRPAVHDAFANQQGMESLGDVFPPVPPEFPPVLSLLHEPPMRGPGPVLGVPPIIAPLPGPLLMPSPNPQVRTNHLRLQMRNSPAHRRASASSRDSPPVTAASAPGTPPATTSAPTAPQDVPVTPKTPSKSEAPSGPEESDTDSMEQYMNTVGLSDDEEFKAIVGAMDPQFICDVVEGPSRNGVDGSEVSSGDKASTTNSPKDGPPMPPGPQPLLSTPILAPSTPDSASNPGSGGFSQTPRSRPWKHRGGGRGGMTPHRFHGPRSAVTASPGWGPPPHHGRGRPAFRPLLSGVPRGMPYRAVMRGNPRFGW